MKKKGFTLIEIIIVLLVFSVGILAVLKLILYNMSTMSDLETRTTATILAKEGFELAYNTRDSNRLASLPRDCIINNDYNEGTNNKICKNYFLDKQGMRTLQASGNDINRNNITSEDIFKEGKLYIDNANFLKYTHQITDQESTFARYIYFTGVKDGETIINTGYLLKIESHVLYQKGSKTGEIILEGFIGNY